MLQISQVWLVVTWSADFESRLIPRSGTDGNSNFCITLPSTPYYTIYTLHLQDLFFSCVFEKENAKKNSSSLTLLQLHQSATPLKKSKENFCAVIVIYD